MKKPRRKGEAWKERDAERAARAEEEHRAGYLKFGLAPDLDDPLDPLFNKYPYRWPDFFRWVHRDVLRELLHHYDKREIQAEIHRHEEAMTAEHARLAAMAVEYTDRAQLAEARTKVAPTVGWRGFAPQHQFHFDVLVHVIVALRIWNEEGADAGMRVLLGDKESAEFWRLGLVNADAHEYGAEQKTSSTALKHAEDAERFLELALDFRDTVQKTCLDNAVEYIVERGLQLAIGKTLRGSSYARSRNLLLRKLRGRAVRGGRWSGQ